MDNLKEELIQLAVDGYNIYQQLIDKMPAVTLPYSERKFNERENMLTKLKASRDWYMELYLHQTKSDNNLIKELGLVTG